MARRQHRVVGVLRLRWHAHLGHPFPVPSAVAYVVWNGVVFWGEIQPVAWGWPIVALVFWVGIGHAGTLISAILFLFRQRWRTSINRAAEAMSIFAVICAMIFPLFHTGRVWVAWYWMLPIPNQMDLWPQFKRDRKSTRLNSSHVA